MVDYIGGFAREDLLDCLTRASVDLTGDADIDRIGFVVDMLLGELEHFNGEYRDADLGRVVTGLQPFLEYLRERGGGTP